MAHSSRLHPNKTSRAALKMLKSKRILSRRKVGLRHIIKTDGAVRHIGYTYSDWSSRELPNFYPGTFRAHREVVAYNGERAELNATLGYPSWEGHILDVGTHFPPNPLATQLLTAGLTGTPMSGTPLTVYGDAVLVTDYRMHWVFNPYDASIEDVESFNDALTTPRDLIKGSTRASIFFHVEPNQNDLVTFKMRWL